MTVEEQGRDHVKSASPTWHNSSSTTTYMYRLRAALFAAVVLALVAQPVASAADAARSTKYRGVGVVEVSVWDGRMSFCNDVTLIACVWLLFYLVI